MTDFDPWSPADPRNKHRTHESASQVRAILMDWDPIGVQGAEGAEDEYDCMISPLMHLLHDGKPEADVTAWVENERQEHFGLRANHIADARLSAELQAWWQRRTSAEV